MAFRFPFLDTRALETPTSGPACPVLDLSGPVLTQAVEVLIASGVVRGKRCTGHPDLAPAAKKAGAKFSSREIELADHIVTGRDDAVGMRFGQRLAQIVGI